METIKQTLENRGDVYGDYLGGTTLRSDIYNSILLRYAEVNDRQMDPVNAVMIFDIVNKLVRLSTTPDHKDTWHDIAGYATLAEEALNEQD